MRLIFIGFILSSLLLAVSAKDIVIGQKINLKSDVIGEERPLWIYAPETVNKELPLFTVYVLDAEVHFHTVTGIVKSLVDYDQIPGVLVVGIETTDRSRDFLPEITGEPQTEFQTFVKSKWPNSGHQKFLKFLKSELFPYIESNYNVNSHRTLIGHSNGGTLALSALFNQPELFNNYLAISPNGWWSHEQVVGNVEKLKAQSGLEKLFITVGGEGGRFYTGTMDLLSSLETEKPDSLTWTYKQYPEQTHMSGILPALNDGLPILFKEFVFKVTPEMAKFANVDFLTGYYEDLSKRNGFTVPVPVDIYVEFSEQQQKKGRKEEAITTLQKFLNDYPNKAYAHMRLAQGYEKLEKFKDSYQSYVTALEVAKGNDREPYIIDALNDMVLAAEKKLSD